MQDLSDNRLKQLREQTGDLREMLAEDPHSPETEAALRKEFDATGKVKVADQGPLFIEGEVVSVKGYGYKIHALVGQRIILKPHGPLQEQGDE